MTVWDVLEWTAWVLSALVAGWLVYDAVKTSKQYSEEFLTHTIEDLGDSDFADSDEAGTEGARS